jgi:hypothetical protein
LIAGNSAGNRVQYRWRTSLHLFVAAHGTNLLHLLREMETVSGRLRATELPSSVILPETALAH